MMELNRPDPTLDPAEMQTYQIVAPPTTHFRSATCEEMDCEYQALGWRTVVDESSELGMSQAHYIRTESGRQYAEQRLESGLTEFRFIAGQQCFRVHKRRIDKPEIFILRQGDYRGNPRGTMPLRFANPDEWVDSFANHQDAIKTVMERG